MGVVGVVWCGEMVVVVAVFESKRQLKEVFFCKEVGWLGILFFAKCWSLDHDFVCGLWGTFLLYLGGQGTSSSSERPDAASADILQLMFL